MKYFCIIVYCFTSLKLISQDSTANIKPLFNYVEINLNSSLQFEVRDLNHATAHSFNSINAGVKIGHHKMTAGIELNPVYMSAFGTPPSSEIYSPNFKANYFFYFTKKQKPITHFIFLNFNTQTIKDYVNYGIYEQKKGYALGLGYGVSFYIKKYFLIEPNIMFNPTYYKNKNIYTNYSQNYVSYTEEITPSYIYYVGANLKIGYIIPFKNK